MFLKSYTRFHFFIFFGLLLNACQAISADDGILTPIAPTVNAGAYILEDFATGKVLAENNADVKLAPASLTKIMANPWRSTKASPSIWLKPFSRWL